MDASILVKLIFASFSHAFRHHHLHHAIVWGNYAPFLTYLDKLVGTEVANSNEAGRWAGVQFAALRREECGNTALAQGGLNSG